MTAFKTLLEESVLTQSLIALLLLVTTCYLYVTSTSVPTELIGLDGLVLGFYFGNKVNYQTRKVLGLYENTKSDSNH